MPKSYPGDETRSADLVERIKGRRPPNANQKSRKVKAPKRQTRRKGVIGTHARTKPAIKKQTKQEICLALLSRPEGATIEELQAVSGWRQHSVRGFLAGAVKKRLGLALLSEKPDGEPRCYRISSTV